jgi:hypothetical protein
VQTEIKFLGHVIRNGQILPDPEKLEAIRKFPIPKNAKELRGYMGLVGWIRKFSADLMISLAPFRSLLKDLEPFTWEEKHTKAMEEINNRISDNLALEIFKPGEPLELWTDASPYGYGAVLLQNNRPLYCASRSLTKAEKNYPQIDLELGAIAWAFKRLDAYVYGTCVQVCTDHKPLIAISQKQIGDLSMRQQRMFARLLRYDYKLTYVSEKLMAGPDALSRAPLPLRTCDESSPQNPLAPDGKFDEIFISELEHVDLSDLLIQQILEHSRRDETYQELVKALRNGISESSKAKVGEYWSIRHDLYVAEELLFRNRELLIPANCRSKVLNALHRGHQGSEQCNAALKAMSSGPV